MKLGVWSSYYIDLSPEEAVDRFCQNGIYASELSDEHGAMLLERGDDVKRIGEEFKAFLKSRGFDMPQGHLWLKAKICADESAVAKICRWIDLYEAIGIKNMVLHCDNLANTSLSKQEKQQMNVERLKIIAEHIKDKEVTLCLENLRPHFRGECDLVDESADDLLAIIDMVGSPRLGICLDTGHLNLTLKDQRRFVLTAGDKLKALHIANNDGTADQHTMPFGRGSVDFASVVKALREIGYDGIFNLEIPGESRIPLPLRDAKLAYIRTGYEYLVNR